MAKSMKADFSNQTDTAFSRRCTHLSNLLSFGSSRYAGTKKQFATESMELELQLDADIDDKGRVKEISIHH